MRRLLLLCVVLVVSLHTYAREVKVITDKKVIASIQHELNKIIASDIQASHYKRMIDIEEQAHPDRELDYKDDSYFFHLTRQLEEGKKIVEKLNNCHVKIGNIEIERTRHSIKIKINK